MKFRLNKKLAEGYSSKAQVARRVTEDWVWKKVFSPCCSAKFVRHANNNVSSDYHCSMCGKNYELKASCRKFGKRITGANYFTTLEHFQKNCPNFLLMNYNSDKLSVTSLVAIPNRCFHPKILTKRKPLAPTARRAGWVGCYINLEYIPEDARVPLIREGIQTPDHQVRDLWKKSLLEAEIVRKQIESRQQSSV